MKGQLRVGARRCGQVYHQHRGADSNSRTTTELLTGQRSTTPIPHHVLPHMDDLFSLCVLYPLVYTYLLRAHGQGTDY